MWHEINRTTFFRLDIRYIYYRTSSQFQRENTHIEVQQSSPPRHGGKEI